METAGIESVDVVLIGKVKSIKAFIRKNTVSLKVKESFKWDYKKGDIIEVSTNIQSSACGFLFKRRKRYAIYGDKKKKVRVNICSHTEKVSLSQAKNYSPKKTISRK